MARSLTIKAIDRRAGVTYIRYGKKEIEIPGGVDALKDWIRRQFADGDEALLAVGLAAYLARDPDLGNPAQIVGKTITLDLSGRINYPDSVIRVS